MHVQLIANAKKKTSPIRAILSLGANVMPPAIVRTIQDLIYWKYAKIIADSADIGKKD
jgi:hypothetical protein